MCKKKKKIAGNAAKALSAVWNISNIYNNEGNVVFYCENVHFLSADSSQVWPVVR